jgi:hypothetical protein
MKSMNIISGLFLLVAAMATPLLSGCTAEVDPEAEADDAVVANDTGAVADNAEKTGSDQEACGIGGFGAFGLGWGGGLGCGGLGWGGGLGCGGLGWGGGLGCGGLGVGVGVGIGAGIGCGVC